MINLDRIAKFIGDVSRPLSIFFVSSSGAVASVITSLRVDNGNDGALLIAAIFVGVGALYGVKSVEVWKTHRADAEVKIEEAKNG